VNATTITPRPVIVILGTWAFNGPGLPYTERWTFTPAKRRNARRVRLSFKMEINRVRNLPAWPELFAKKERDGIHYFEPQIIRAQDKKGNSYQFRPARFNWKPDHPKTKSVQWTRLPKIATNINHGFAPFSGGESV
jgi:hypothetical protein